MDICCKVLRTSRKLVSSILLVDCVHQLQLANSARLSLTNGLKLIEKSQTCLSDGQIVESLRDEYEQTVESVQQLLEMIKSR